MIGADVSNEPMEVCAGDLQVTRGLSFVPVAFGNRLIRELDLVVAQLFFERSAWERISYAEKVRLLQRVGQVFRSDALPCAMMIAPWIAFSSSRTLPSQEWSSRSAIALG